MLNWIMGLRGLITLIATVVSLVYACKSTREVRGQKISKLQGFLFIIVNLIILGVPSPWVQAVALVFIALLAIRNQEGDFRKASWISLSLAYGAAGILSAAALLDKDEEVGYKLTFGQVVPGVVILAAFVFAIICAIKGGSEDKPRLSKNATFVITCVALVAIIALTVVASIMTRKG